MRRMHPEETEIISNINVTPLVDIMLVLLIIFMLVSTFISFAEIDVELPEAATGEDAQVETLSIAISRSGEYYLSGEKTASFESLMERVGREQAKQPELQVVISADKQVYHGEVVRVIDTLRKMKIYKFAINVEKIEGEEEIRK
ncbi:MAG: biopolymer transporter ExbD [Desulfatiglandales bacterium]